MCVQGTSVFSVPKERGHVDHNTSECGFGGTITKRMEDPLCVSPPWLSTNHLSLDHLR